jgi:hypothetical protein
MLAVHSRVTNGLSVTTAVTDFVESAAEIAVTEISWVELIRAGAVYKPELEMVPTAGSSDQLRAVLDVPFTLAVNC